MPPEESLRELRRTLGTAGGKAAEAIREERITAWRDRIRADAKEHRKEVLKYLRNKPFSSFSLLERQNGTLPGAYDEIEELVQKAWKDVM